MEEVKYLNIKLRNCNNFVKSENKYELKGLPFSFTTLGDLKYDTAKTENLL
jgi:hypothetical protein